MIIYSTCVYLSAINFESKQRKNNLFIFKQLKYSLIEHSFSLHFQISIIELHQHFVRNIFMGKIYFENESREKQKALYCRLTFQI